MGRIKRFNISRFIRLTNAEYFFETGTWRGDGLAYASKYPFKKIFSSEIIDSVAEKAIARFSQDKRVEIINEPSLTALESKVKEIPGNTIFWLDAHFPGAEEGLKDYNEIEDENIKLPLQKELEILASRKSIYNDVILVDDLRIYEEGKYESGNLPKDVIPPKVRNSDFATSLFSDTHNIFKFYNDEGYLVIVPKIKNKIPLIKEIMYKTQDRIFKKIF